MAISRRGNAVVGNADRHFHYKDGRLDRSSRKDATRICMARHP